MGKHKPLAASKTKQWWECPGSLAVQLQMPETESASGIYAQMGTAAHGLIERNLGEGSEPRDYADRIIVVIEDEENEGVSILRKNAKCPKDPDTIWFEVDQDMYEACEVMTGYVRRRVCEDLKLWDEYDTPVDQAKACVELIERGVLQLESKTNPLPERNDTGGSCDVTIDAWPDELETIDYKHGSGVHVPIKKNKQLRSYLLGKAIETGFSHDKYTYTIVQPRHPEGGISTESITRQELQEWAGDLDVAAKRVDEAVKEAKKQSSGGPVEILNALYDKGFVSVGEDGEHCTFCDFKTKCPAAFAKAQELADVDFEDDEPEKIATPGENRLAMLLPWFPLLDAWIRDAKAEAERLAMQGRKIDGQKLVRKRSNRIMRPTCYVEIDGEEVQVPITEEIVVDVMCGDFGVDEGDLYTDPKLISGPQMEKLLEKDQRPSFNRELLLKPEGGLTLVPEDDKREEVVVDPSTDFDDNPDNQ